MHRLVHIIHRVYTDIFTCEQSNCYVNLSVILQSILIDDGFGAMKNAYKIFR